MNVRPTRVPSPPQHEAAYAEPTEATFVEVEQAPSHVPARRAQQNNAIPSEGPVQQPTLPTTPFAKLAGAIAAVMAEIKPVEKSGWNDFHKYNYAKMGDLSIELTPLMGRHGIVVFQNEVDRAMFDEGKVISVRYQFTVVHSSGEIWPERPLITGMSRCRDSKGGFDDKAFNKAHTAARKYFLLSLFQIPTDDEHPDVDNDGDGSPRQRPQGRRPVPSPSGKIPPYLIPIEQGEAPKDWSRRFAAFVAKAASSTEIDQWYNENAAQFDKLKRHDEAVYNSAIDFMDECAAKLAAPKREAKSKEKKVDPISSGPIAQAAMNDGEFPGDKPITKAVEIDTSIPLTLDRKLTDAERDWLVECNTAFAECQDSESLASEQDSIMMPAKDSASEYAWARAVAIVKEHLARVQQ